MERVYWNWMILLGLPFMMFTSILSSVVLVSLLTRYSSNASMMIMTVLLMVCLLGLILLFLVMVNRQYLRYAADGDFIRASFGFYGMGEYVFNLGSYSRIYYGKHWSGYNTRRGYYLPILLMVRKDDLSNDVIRGPPPALVGYIRSRKYAVFSEVDLQTMRGLLKHYGLKRIML